MSFNITIDGNKELHDACRIFQDGSPSYDIAMAAVNDWVSMGNIMSSKVTLSPYNISYTYKAIVHMIECGYTEIFSNCVFEKGWTTEHASIFYNQLKQIADYMIDHNLEYSRILTLFDSGCFAPMNPEDNQNWCGGTGSMLSIDPDGDLYPCIRYMHSSLGDMQKPLRIGDVYNGIGQLECDKDCLHCLDNITRKSQSTEECFNCPIALGCAWCSGYNYQVNGTPNKRVTYVCIMHKARALANIYFYNKVYLKHDTKEIMKNYVKDEWALEIISQDELNMLNNLVKEAERHANNN